MKTFFITGTDTHCGKTYVLCQLLDYFHGIKKKALGIKPVASGLCTQEGRIFNEDLAMLQHHNPPLNFPINYWSFSSPIAPHLAAREEDVCLTAEAIATFCQQPPFHAFDYLLIEGAGGIYVPLNDKESWLDFLKIAGIPVILVVGMRLGCLNHALLTSFFLTSHSIPCYGWIANCLDNSILSLDENIHTLITRMPMPLLGIVPYKGKFVLNESKIKNMI